MVDVWVFFIRNIRHFCKHIRLLVSSNATSNNKHLIVTVNLYKHFTQNQDAQKYDLKIQIDAVHVSDHTIDRIISGLNRETVGGTRHGSFDIRQIARNLVKSVLGNGL